MSSHIGKEVAQCEGAVRDLLAIGTDYALVTLENALRTADPLTQRIIVESLDKLVGETASHTLASLLVPTLQLLDKQAFERTIEVLRKLDATEIQENLAKALMVAEKWRNQKIVEMILELEDTVKLSIFEKGIKIGRGTVISILLDIDTDWSQNLLRTTLKDQDISLRKDVADQLALASKRVTGGLALLSHPWAEKLLTEAWEMQQFNHDYSKGAGLEDAVKAAKIEEKIQKRNEQEWAQRLQQENTIEYAMRVIPKLPIRRARTDESGKMVTLGQLHKKLVTFKKQYPLCKFNRYSWLDENEAKLEIHVWLGGSVARRPDMFVDVIRVDQDSFIWHGPRDNRPWKTAMGFD